MLKIFKKDHSNVTFLQELLHKNFDKEWLKEALDSKKVDINYVDDYGNSFLMKCMKVGKFKPAIWLIENGIDLTLENDENEAAFDYAIAKNNHEILNMILDNHDIAINETDNEGRTLLQNAVVQGSNGVAKILIKHGAELNNIDMHGRNVVYDALSYGDENFIRYLSSLEGIDLNTIDDNGNSVMLHPQVIKDDDIAKDMLRAGADPTIKNKSGNSFLLTTALRGEEADGVIDVLLENSGGSYDSNKIVKELVDISAKLPDEDKEKRDRLLRTAKKTMKSGAKVNSVKSDNSNESGLFDAVRLNDYELSSFLLTSGMDPNLQNDEGSTALVESIYDGMKNIKIIKLLLEHGATPNIKNNKNETLYSFDHHLRIDLFA
jgi:ankyrin repeat protein